jgi:transglutaminase-like putative cysteine protease
MEASHQQAMRRLLVRYKVGCNLSYQIGSNTTFIFNIEAARIASQQIIEETLTLTPEVERNAYTDMPSGNRYFGANVVPGEFAVEYNAVVELAAFRADPAAIHEWPINALPLNILPFLLPSRFVSSDRLGAFALAEFGSLPMGHQRVNAICGWIHDHLAYQPGSSDQQTTADETLLKRAGVCRDFAHLGIAFCRGLGIPARFLSCYAYGLQPSDFHAVFEAYLEGRWWLFDATRQADLDGLVRIGVGRDAAEIAFSTPFGTFTPTSMAISIAQADGGSKRDTRTIDAISTDDAQSAGFMPV